MSRKATPSSLMIQIVLDRDKMYRIAWFMVSPSRRRRVRSLGQLSPMSAREYWFHLAATVAALQEGSSTVTTRGLAWYNLTDAEKAMKAVSGSFDEIKSLFRKAAKQDA